MTTDDPICVSNDGVSLIPHSAGNRNCNMYSHAIGKVREKVTHGLWDMVKPFQYMPIFINISCYFVPTNREVRDV